MRSFWSFEFPRPSAKNGCPDRPVGELGLMMKRHWRRARIADPVAPHLAEGLQPAVHRHDRLPAANW
jgi:hypothetical protein